MRRRRNNFDKPRERRTLVPAFSPEELAAKIENEANCATSRPAFDPMDYARTVEEHREVIDRFDASEAETEPEKLQVVPEFPNEPSSGGTSAAIRGTSGAIDVSYGDHAIAVVVSSKGSMVLPPQDGALALDDTLEPDTKTEDIGREMYSSYLASDFPEALVLAEQVLDREPSHALAQLVLDRCRERLRPAPSTTTPLRPSSIVRLKFSELERQSKHIDARTSFVLGHVDGVTDAGTVAALSGLPPPEALDRLHALLDLGVIEVVA